MLPEVCGIPLFWLLDHRGFAVYLVNAPLCQEYYGCPLSLVIL
ncbi:MAG: hypothetical protein ACYCT9_04290 [Leptospirillum sp.]